MNQTFRVVLSCALLIGTILVIQLRSTGEAVPIRKPLDGLPTVLASWEARQDSLLQPEIVNFLKVDDYVMRRYVDTAGNTLWLYVGYWASQRRGASQVHSPKNCLPAGGWQPLEASRLTVDVPGRGPITVNRYLIQKDQDMQVVLYWYQAQGTPVPGEIDAKLEMLRSAVLRNRTDGVLVRVSAPVSAGATETTDRLIRYVQVLYPVLSEHLPD